MVKLVFAVFSLNTVVQLRSAMIRQMPFVCLSYEPELFPGLIYRMIKPRIVLLIFVSGKVVLTGKMLMILNSSFLERG